jgi:hypothetical protein
VRALVDTGCSKSIVSKSAVQGLRTVSVNEPVVMMNGEASICAESACLTIGVNGKEVCVNVLVTSVLPGFGMLLGMDVIDLLGGCHIVKDTVSFGSDGEICAVAESNCIDDRDFSAKFQEGRWIVRWKWNGEAPTLTNWVSQFKIKAEAEEGFNAEVREWIEQGWLQPYSGEHDGIVPLLAVVQHNKLKLRPVMDYREINRYVSSHTGDSAVCGESLRRWRKMGDNVKIIDLRKAYLQLHVDPEQWKYQVVVFEGRKYCLTRLGFGLSVAPRIMTAVLTKILSA